MKAAHTLDLQKKTWTGNEDEHFKRLEQQNQNLDEYGMEQAEKNNIETILDFDEWRNTDQATYFEFSN